MNKAEFLSNLRRERARWEARLAEVDGARLLQPELSGGQSIKDVMAHIAWYEREMVGVIGSRALAGSDLWDLSQDQRNAAIFEANRDRPLAEVRAEATQVYRDLLAGLEALSEEDLHNPSRFANMPGDWVPWEVIASNCYEHYPQHLPEIRAWLERPGG